MKNKIIGRIFIFGLVILLAGLVIPSISANLEDNNLIVLENQNNIHDSHNEDCNIDDDFEESTHEINSHGAHGSNNNYYNNININLKNIITTDPHVHHLDNEHTSHSHTANHEHIDHSYHTDNTHKIIIKLSQLCQSIRRIIHLIMPIIGM